MRKSCGIGLMAGRGSRSVLRCALIAGGLCGSLWGCHKLPDKHDAKAFSTPGKFTTKSAEYWSGENVPALVLTGRTRVAIAEFTVEYVTEKINNPGQQPMAGPSEFNPVQGALSYLGVGKTKLAMTADAKEASADELYMEFVRRLEGAGFSVMPMEAVVRSGAYSMYVSKPAGAGGILQRLSLKGEDIGRVMQYESIPAGELEVLERAPHGEEAARRADSALLAQTGADVVMRASFRVGITDAHASVESGSVVRVAYDGGKRRGELRSRRSLLSARPVVRDESGQVFEGYTYTADENPFAVAVNEVFSTYAGLAVQRMK